MHKNRIAIAISGIHIRSGHNQILDQWKVYAEDSHHKRRYSLVIFGVYVSTGGDQQSSCLSFIETNSRQERRLPEFVPGVNFKGCAKQFSKPLHLASLSKLMKSSPFMNSSSLFAHFLG